MSLGRGSGEVMWGGDFRSISVDDDDSFLW